MPTGGENIRKHDVVVFTLLGVLRQHQAVEISVRYTQQLGLAALIGPHVGKAVCGPGSTRVGSEAESCKAFFAVFTEPAADIERQADPITDLDPVYPCTHLDHLTEVFMTEHAPGLERCAPLVHVKVGSADVGSGYAHQRVCRFLDPCIRDIVDGDVARAVINDCFHAELPEVRGDGKAPYPVGVMALPHVFSAIHE
ncbi:hypothetical protein D3C76_754560 [compost metagenome]